MRRIRLLGVLAGVAVALPVPAVMAQQPEEAQAEPVQIPAEDLPSAGEVFAAYVEAIGGDDAVRAVTSRRFTGRVRVFVQGQQDPVQVGRIEMLSKAPGTLVQDMIFPGRSSTRTIVQDGVVWQLDEDDKASLVDETSAARQRVSARFYQLADWEEMFSEVSVLGGVEQNGRRAVQLVGTHLDGRTEVYMFDLDSGMLLMITGERPSPVDASQTVPFRRLYEDYRDTGGVMYPHRVLEQAGPVLFEIEVSEIETGVDVPTFEIPSFEEAEGE